VLRASDNLMCDEVTGPATQFPTNGDCLTAGCGLEVVLVHLAGWETVRRKQGRFVVAGHAIAFDSTACRFARGLVHVYGALGDVSSVGLDILCCRHYERVESFCWPRAGSLQLRECEVKVEARKE
jgi:hypothetical protein